MKKVIVLLTGIIFLISCGSSQKITQRKFLVQNPETDFVPRNINLLQDPQSLVGAYVSLSTGFTLQKGNSVSEQEEFTKNGIVNSFNIFSGEELIVPEYLQIGGKQDVSDYLRNGPKEQQKFLAPIKSVNLDEQGKLVGLVIALLKSDNKTEVLIPFSLKNNHYFFHKLQRSAVSETNDVLEKMNMGQDYQGNLVTKAGRSFYYPIRSNNELWFLHQNKVGSLYIDKFFHKRKNIDKTKRSTARSVLVGPPQYLKK